MRNRQGADPIKEIRAIVPDDLYSDLSIAARVEGVPVVTLFEAGLRLAIRRALGNVFAGAAPLSPSEVATVLEGLGYTSGEALGRVVRLERWGWLRNDGSGGLVFDPGRVQGSEGRVSIMSEQRSVPMIDVPRLALDVDVAEGFVKSSARWRVLSRPARRYEVARRTGSRRKRGTQKLQLAAK